ncbi:MAG: sugar ABC transporter permease [Anaerolineaceae bacterium]|nr:sugar ABC transporter permease [Anaerolineaceae bacterium]
MESIAPNKTKNKDGLTAFLFLLPAIIILGVFNFYPIGSVIRLSFFKWDNLAPDKTWIFLDNFKNLFANPRFWNSLKITFIYTISVTALSIVLGLVLAVLLNKKKFTGKNFWRGVFFLPVITPTVAAAMVWLLLFNPGFGIVNIFLRRFGIRDINWLADIHWALPTVISLGVWRRVGFTLILYLAALQAIPDDYYEAADLDGASGLHKFFSITVPLLRSTTIMLVILGIIDSFLVFDPVMVLTRGGPANATEVLGMYMYFTSFQQFKMGYGAAISVVILIIIVVLTLLQWRFVGFGSSEEEG